MDDLLSNGLHEKASDMFGQSRSDVQFVKNISLEMAIGQQMIEEGHDQNY